jgi:hypothetical protein
MPRCPRQRIGAAVNANSACLGLRKGAHSSPGRLVKNLVGHSHRPVGATLREQTKMIRQQAADATIAHSTPRSGIIPGRLGDAE